MARQPLPVTARSQELSDDVAFALPLSVQSLGAAHVVLGTDGVVPSTGTLFALLLRVAYSPEFRVRRDELLRMLWPEMTPERQRANLRQTLYKARSMGIDASLSGDSVRLNGAQVVRTFSLEQTTALFDRDVVRGSEPFGVFLPSYVVPWPEFQQWVDAQRETVHAGVRRVLVELLRARRERADWTGAERFARWLLQFDSLNEEATFTVAECTLLAGSKTEAVAILDRYLDEIGPEAGDIRLPATLLRKRFMEPQAKRRPTLQATERHFVGRTAELASLTMAMRRARWFDGSAALVMGPAGIGKTRVANELGKVADIEGFREIRSECREGDQHRSLSALTEPLTEMMELRGALGCSPESMSVLRRLLGLDDTGQATGDGHSRNGAVSLAVPQSEPRASGSQSARHAIMDLLGAVTEERPLLLIVENMEWIDDDSWDVLKELAERVSLMRVYVLLSSRSGPRLAHRLADLPPSIQMITLPPLLPDESQKLVRLLSDEMAAPLMPGAEDWIVGASEGSPFFLRALVTHWAETGDAGGIPPTLQGLLDQRIDRLPAAAVRALQTISLLGPFASLDRIIASLQLPTHELLEALDQLEKDGYLAHDEASLVVSHELVGKAATRRMSSLVCAALRSSIADAFEAEFSRIPDVELLLQALHHLDASGKGDAALRFVLRYADSLIDAGRPRGLLTIVQRLSRLKTSVTLQHSLRRIESRLELESGEYAKSLALGSGGLTLQFDAETLTPEFADDTLSLIDSAYRADPIVDKDELCRFTLSVVQAKHLPRTTRLRAAEIGLVIASNTCDNRTADALYAAIAPNPQEIARDDRVQRMALLYHTIFGSINLGSELAGELHKKSSVARASTSSYQDAGRAGFALRLCGKVDQAIEAFINSYNVAIELDAPRLAQFPAWQLANLYLEAADSAATTKWTNTLADLFSSEEDEVSSSFVVSYFCRLAIYNRDFVSALRHFNHCQRVYPRFPTVKAHTYFVALELGTNLLNQEWIPSNAILEVANARYAATCSFGTSDFFVSTFAEALERAGRLPEATALMSTYLKDSRRDRSPIPAYLSDLQSHLNSKNS